MTKCEGALRLFCTVMCISMAAALVLFPAGLALAQCPATCTTEPVVMSDGTGTTGDQIVITLELNNSTADIQSFTLDFQYDNTQLSYVSCVKAGLAENWFLLDCSENIPGEVKVLGFDTSAIPAGSSGVLAELTFDVTCGGCTDGDQSQFIPVSLQDDMVGMDFCCGTFTYVGAAQQEVCPGEPSSCSGATLRVPILVSEPDGLQNIELHLQYDGVSATYVSTERSGLTQTWTTMGGIENSPGDITILGSDIAPLSAVSPDTLCYVVFQVGSVGPDMVLTTTGFAGDLAGTNDCEATICTVPSEDSTWGRIKSLWSDR